jgi:AcrR family transcriptional regulator
METKSSGPGRPSLSSLRRAQIIDGFIALIADRGLDSVTMDDVAAAASLQRAALRHFVGNRRELLAAALEVLVLRFRNNLNEEVGPTPSFDHLLDHLLSGRWTDRMLVEHRAFDVLAQEASRDSQMKVKLRGAYDLLIAEIADALLREHPGVARHAAYDCAYAVMCIAEHHTSMVELGYKRQHTRAAAQAARSLALQLGDGAQEPVGTVPPPRAKKRT